MDFQELSSSLPRLTDDGKARAQSIGAVSVAIVPTSIVGYTSTGRVLVIGPEDDAARAVQNLADAGLKCHLLATDEVREERDEPAEVRVDFRSGSYEVQGYLGAFQVISTAGERRFDLGLYAGHENGKFDLVLELSKAPTIKAEVSPPGYFWIADTDKRASQLADALTEIPDMVGSFEKPKFFNYDPDICAHGRSGIVACTRCIDACPTDAIVSLKDVIEVNSHLCQGGGTCSTACPTGAITYAYPAADNLQEIVRQLISGYLAAGGTKPVLAFYDKETGGPAIEHNLADMQENVLPVEVEEVGSIGLDVILNAIAYGAAGIKVLCLDLASAVHKELTDQFAVMRAMLDGMGYALDLVELVDSPALLFESATDDSAAFDIPLASHAPTGLKRTDIRSALEHLYDHAAKQPVSVALPAHAPFGNIQVDTGTCTLCMGCVSVCPAAALEAGGESPKLAFIEHNCVQCGLCEKACPESSISKEPRYLFNTDQRMRSQTLNEDAPFHCRLCGKPFATQAMLNNMREKLKGHWMFEDNSDAMKRLEMCEDCRVKDMFAAEGGFPRHKL